MQKKMSEFALVSMMNSAFGNPQGNPNSFVGQVGPNQTKVFDEVQWDRLDRQLRNIYDEIKELHDAFRQGPVDAVRDALCDIRVFAYGGLHFIGFDYDMSLDYTNISAGAPIPSMLTKLHPVTSLNAAWEYLMVAVKERDRNTTILRTGLVIWLAKYMSNLMGLSKEQQEADMEAVIGGVMTRFIKDDVDLEQTMAKFKERGVETFYTEGEYPTMILKSDGDYPDAPKGKFLKAVSYQDTVFPELANAEEVEAKMMGYRI